MSSTLGDLLREVAEPGPNRNSFHSTAHSCRLVGPGRHRYRYHSTYPRAASGARRNEPVRSATTIATKEMLRRSRHRSLSQRRPLWCPRLATGFELAVVAQKRRHARR